MSDYNKYEAVKEYIQIFLDVNGEPEMNHLYYDRSYEYKTDIDAGYENLSLRDDQAKIKLYMECDILKFENGRLYKVIERIFKPDIPVKLILRLKEIGKEDLKK